MDEPVVVTEDLTKRFDGKLAVDHLDLSVDPGTIYGFIGPSGSGKTTAVRLLTGILRPTAGQVRVFGSPPTTFGARQRAKIGYMPQLSGLYPHLSIWENLSFVASIYGLPLRRRRRLMEVLDFVQLRDDRRKLLREASGGMQRRVALAATLLHRPSLLFLDEPTAGIDPVLRRRFWDHFRDLRDQGRTLFITTQYIGEAAYCDVVGVLAGGRLLAADSPESLRRRAFDGVFVDVTVDRALSEDALEAALRLPSVLGAERVGSDGRGLRLRVREHDRAGEELKAWADQHGLRLRSLAPHEPSFDDVFVAIVGGAGGKADG